MNSIQNRVVILELDNANSIECIRLLENNGYQVEVLKKTTKALTQYSHFTEVDFHMPHTVEQNKDEMLIQTTCRHLEKNIYSKFILDDIAAVVGSNRSKLAATFKRVLGMGVFEWLRNHRMLKAKSLLIYSGLSIQAIGFEVGYENSANFSSAYKKQFQISPRQQRVLSKVKVITGSKVLSTQSKVIY